MSICIFDKGVLYCDRTGIVRSAPGRYIEMNKLYVSKGRHFALAISGPSLTVHSPAVINRRMKELLEFLKTAEPISANIILTEPLSNFLSARAALLVTKKSAYYLTDEDEKALKFTLVDTCAPVMIGSGSDFASIAMIAGKTAVEAMKIAATVDIGNKIGPIDTLDVETLNPIN